ncbi:hypothetical protein FB45DRAFT_1053305 [Roridomyces roridus]|uniref:F-box domain-containing protein n=1 Tax=Roridomyces roridus TaxID=1738132 RepID=A0AAD7CC52_9AGAR|nr:hypothetical protein FB45DRAFT_1053305 [Roridomyces roridus]
MPQSTIFTYSPSKPDSQPSESRTRRLIAASEASISALKAQVVAEREVLARLRAVVAPVRKLPAELLLEIFMLILVEVGKETHRIGFVRSRLRPRLALTQVCARWRHVMHTSPQIWAVGIELYVRQSTTSDDLAAVQRWLDRSAPLPIPISLSSGLDALSSSAMEVLCSTAHRWAKATLHALSLCCLTRIPEGSLTSLTTLELSGGTDDQFDPAKLTVFSNAPNLRTLTLYINYPTRIPMPWSQLTSLTFAEFPLTCLEILRRCTRLVTAVFDTAGWEFVPDLSLIRMITIGSLTNLSITVSENNFPSEHFMPFLSRLALPELKVLRLYLDPPNTNWDTIEFTQFQLRSPNLEELTIRESPLTSDALIAVLRSSPSLANLTMHKCPHSFNDDVIDALRYLGEDGRYTAPKLEEILLTQSGQSFDPENLEEMIRSRWWTDEELAAMPSPPAVARWGKVSVYAGSENSYRHFRREFKGHF